MSLTDTVSGTVRPQCCMFAPNALHGPDEKGWALTLAGTYDSIRENVKFCPWCGKKLL